jgi:hypothetical protein
MADEKGKPGGKEFQLEAQVNGEKDPRSDAGEWIPAFLATLATTANIYLACRQAGITRKTAYKWKEENEEFDQRYREDELYQVLFGQQHPHGPDLPTCVSSTTGPRCRFGISAMTER